MFFSISTISVIVSMALGALAAPVYSELQLRANPCFITGTAALPAEVANGISALAKSITCDANSQSVTGVPGVSSAGVSFASIDFQKSAKSPLGFALEKFATPTNPATANLAALQNQLNDYLAVEAGVRSHGGGAILNKVKSVKFFLQFQIARVKTANGQTVTFQNSVEHQLGKVIKNAIGASAAEKAQVTALSKQL